MLCFCEHVHVERWPVSAHGHDKQGYQQPAYSERIIVIGHQQSHTALLHCSQQVEELHEQQKLQIDQQMFRVDQLLPDGDCTILGKGSGSRLQTYGKPEAEPADTRSDLDVVAGQKMPGGPGEFDDDISQPVVEVDDEKTIWFERDPDDVNVYCEDAFGDRFVGSVHTRSESESEDQDD